MKLDGKALGILKSGKPYQVCLLLSDVEHAWYIGYFSGKLFAYFARLRVISVSITLYDVSPSPVANADRLKSKPVTVGVA